MNERSLSQKMLMQFAACIAVLLLLATPLFHYLTERYYAEDMASIVDAVGQGRPIPALDLEEDILHGIMIQFCLITLVLAAAIVLTLRFIARRLWRPFDETLRRIEGFRLEDGALPDLPESGTAEFTRLNRTLTALMRGSLASYRTQKEFTENASHELQTPLAVMRSQLDLLMQSPGLTREQAERIQSLYETAGRLARLNRSLLLLSKIENSQYSRTEETELAGFIAGLLPSLESISGSIAIRKELHAQLTVRANRTLLESLVNNLVVNAVRHNRPDGEIAISVTGRQLAVSNTSDGPALDEAQIFNRFYRPSERTKGCGLGLAIVKAVCDYHGWRVSYRYEAERHVFRVDF